MNNSLKKFAKLGTVTRYLPWGERDNENIVHHESYLLCHDVSTEAIKDTNLMDPRPLHGGIYPHTRPRGLQSW